MNPTNERTCYKTLGTGVTYRSMSHFTHKMAYNI